MKQERGHDHGLVDRTLSPVQERTVTQPGASASASQGSRLWTQLRHELLPSVAGHRGLLRGFFRRMRARARGMCGREDTATLMKNWKCKH